MLVRDDARANTLTLPLTSFSNSLTRPPKLDTHIWDNSEVYFKSWPISSM